MLTLYDEYRQCAALRAVILWTMAAASHVALSAAAPAASGLRGLSASLSFVPRRTVSQLGGRETDHDIATAKVLRLAGGGGPAPIGKSVENHAPFLLCTDLDDTLVGDAQSLAEFNSLWKEELAPRGCKLVFNTGRSFIDYLALRRDWDMLLPDAFIGGCGTQVYTFDAQGQEHPVRAWAEALQSSSSWDKQQVASQILCDARLKALYSTGHELREKSESEGNELLLSLHLPATTTDVEQVHNDLLAALHGCNREELGVNVASVSFKGATTVTGSGNSTSGADGCLFVDVMPIAAGKGRALAYVRHTLFAMSAAQCVVAGDSGNDVAMFESDVERGIMVGNAKSELLAICRPSHFVASAKYAAGLLQGLYHYGLLVSTAIDRAPWRERLLPTCDNSVQSYCWNHGARELIAERKRVAEILALRVQAKRGPWHVERQGIGYLGISMSFQEAFIDSDTERITLMDRVHTYFNAQWKRDVISFQQLPETCGDKFPEASDQDMRIQTELCGRHWPEADQDMQIANYRDMRIENWRKQILMRYKDAEGHLTTILEKLVVLQALCEELKPETRDLIKRCSSPEQLDMSMLTMKKSPTQESSNGLLPPSIRKRQEGLVELVEPETEIASGEKLFPLKDLEGIIDGFRTQIERNNYVKSLPLASFYDREKVAFLEPIFNLFKDIQGRLEILEKRS
jgi:sucrose-6-phosphatase